MSANATLTASFGAGGAAGSKPGTATGGFRAQTAGSSSALLGGGFEAGPKPGTAGSSMTLVPRAGTAGTTTGTISGGAGGAGGGAMVLVDPNASGPVQTHLEELQKKYRALDMARRLYADDSANTIRMQRQQIDKLKKDNDRLKDDLAIETRQAKQANNLSTSTQIARLQDQADMYAKKIAVENRRKTELDRQIAKLQETIHSQRKEMGGVNFSRDNNMSVQKNIRRLENQLDKALVKFNQALAQNARLRDTINGLRRERGRFEKMYKDLETELNNKKASMDVIMQQSHSAFSARQQAHEQMVLLKAEADREQKDFEQRWADLGAAIDQDKKLKDMMNSKKGAGAGVDGSDGGSGDRVSGGAAAGKGTSIAAEENRLKGRVAKGAWGIAKDKANIHLSMQKVQAYEEAFAKIHEATKIKEIDLLVKTFISAEDENFSQFNYVNELSAKIEKLEDSIKDLRGEIARYKGQQAAAAAGAGGAAPAAGAGASTALVVAGASSPSTAPGSAQQSGPGSDVQRKRILADLEEKLKRTEGRGKVYEQKYSAASRTIGNLKAGIESMFQKIGCANSATAELLGNAGVTESNMMQYLGIIEQRTNQLLAAYAQQHPNQIAVTSKHHPNNRDRDGKHGGTRGGKKKDDAALMAELRQELDREDDGAAGAGADGDAGADDAEAGDDGAPLDADALRQRQQKKLNSKSKAAAGVGAKAGASVVTPAVEARVAVLARFLAGVDDPSPAAQANLSAFSLPHVRAFLTVMDPELDKSAAAVDAAMQTMIQTWGGDPNGFASGFMERLRDSNDLIDLDDAEAQMPAIRAALSAQK